MNVNSYYDITFAPSCSRHSRHQQRRATMCTTNQNNNKPPVLFVSSFITFKLCRDTRESETRQYLSSIIYTLLSSTTKAKQTKSSDCFGWAHAISYKYICIRTNIPKKNRKRAIISSYFGYVVVLHLLDFSLLSYLAGACWGFFFSRE